MKNLYVSMYLKMKGFVQNQKGAQSLEWLGIAALLIMVVGIISTYLGDQKSAITGIIDKIITEIKEQISGS